MRGPFVESDDGEIGSSQLEKNRDSLSEKRARPAARPSASPSQPLAPRQPAAPASKDFIGGVVNSDKEMGHGQLMACDKNDGSDGFSLLLLICSHPTRLVALIYQ